MEYRGHVKGGVVVFEEEIPPEGTAVRVQVVPVAGQEPTLWQKLQKYAGTIRDMPADMARNHDHYIHGAPNK